MTDRSVEVVDVRKKFGRTHALAGVSLHAEPGITGLLGPNGAGKTTLLRMLATVLAPDAGRLRLLGRDPSKHDDRLAIRRRLGYVPQEPGLYQNFTAFEFVDYVAILKEMTDRRARHDDVRRVLALVGLTDVSGRKIRTLSGGMRRRVGLAQALLGAPTCWCSTSPPPASTPSSACASARWCRPSPSSTPCCCRRTRPRTSPPCASGWSCSTRA